MATLVRQKKTYYVDAAGKRVPKGTSGAVKRTDDQGIWYGQGIPGMPPTKRIPLATDKRVAQKALADMVAAAERGIRGMPAVDLSRADLGGLIAEFESDMLLGLANKNRSAKKRPSTAEAKQTAQRVRAVVEGCRFKTCADLNDAAPAKVARYLAERAELPRKEGGLSAQSCEFYRKTIGRFAWWLSVRKRAPVRADLFADVPAFDAKRERVHLRRALTNAELATLLDATRTCGVDEYDLTPEDRYFLYLTAVATGFRAAELASLTPSSFRLTDSPPTVALVGKRAKNRTAAVLPLPSGLAVQLPRYLAGKPAGEPVWGGRWAIDFKAAEILRRDLERAGIPYRVDSPEGPRYADFHSLRHLFATRLVETGVNPKELQTLVRHADAETTLNYYTHTTPTALAAAVDRMQLPTGKGSENPLAALTRAELEAAVVGLLGVVNVLLGQDTAGRRATAKSRTAA